tara:strand:- start:5871 stop:7730 length:1860 start_codon:yes stop_codon:yes gene_type:complete
MPSTTAKYIFFFSSGRRFVRVTARAACARLLLAMSGVYQLEPPTEGKVLLTTTHGEIEIELWSKECPKACRNFVQLCLDGYYDGCVWHRVIKDFMIQTGDPTGTGKGGESSFDDGVPFKDELHSRIKFNHRGQVAMANTGTRDTNGESFPILPRSASLNAHTRPAKGLLRPEGTIPNPSYDGVQYTLPNPSYQSIIHMARETDTFFCLVSGSQFFVTLERCDWIDRKHTIFGKVSGHTIYNAIQIGEIEVDGDRPVDEPFPKILQTEVLWNPFDDVAARVKTEKKEETLSLKKKPKETKKLNLLSFGDEAEEEDTTVTTFGKAKVRSVFEDTNSEKGGNSRMVAPGSAEEIELLKKDEEDRLRLRRERMEKQKEELAKDAAKASAVGTVDDDPAGGFDTKMRTDVNHERAKAATELAAIEAKDEAKRLRKDAKAEKTLKKATEKNAKETQKLKKLGIGKVMVGRNEAELMTGKERARVETKRKRANVAHREAGLLAKLAKFQSKVVGSLKNGGGNAQTGAHTVDAEKRTSDGANGDTTKTRDGATGVARFVPQGLYYAEDSEDDDDDAEDWKSHALTFSDDKRKDPAAHHASVDDYEVHDPLLEKGKGKFAKRGWGEKR